MIAASPAPGDSSDSGGSAMAPFALGAISAGLVAKLASPTLAVIPIGLAIVFVLLRRRPSEGHFVLRVDDASTTLEVTHERPKSPPLRIPLADLLDVTFDRRSHQAGGRGGSATERVQIALEQREPAPAILVPAERVTPIEAQEWYAKIRVFLRQNGWTPASERDQGPSANASATR